MISKPKRILGIESSCDETAAAVVACKTSDTVEVLSSIVFSQAELHENFGGVVPEIAARAHAERLDICVKEALAKAQTSLTQISAIAVTAGPGLVGGLLSGVLFAKGLALGSNTPIIGVNHLAGHALTPRLTDHIAYPYLMLLVSGGHCQFLIVNGPDQFDRLGGTIDDAPGEAFDKTARLLGLPQPGGPSIERAAKTGDPGAFSFPRPLMDQAGCNLSFSGLKTAVLRARDTLVQAQGGLYESDVANFSASFQAAVGEVLAAKSKQALVTYLAQNPKSPVFCVAGGVAANQYLRSKLIDVAQERNVSFIAPPLSLCTDNAAMIANAGAELFQKGQISDMSLSARPRWPLDTSKAALLGGGKKGARA